MPFCVIQFLQTYFACWHPICSQTWLWQRYYTAKKGILFKEIIVVWLGFTLYVPVFYSLVFQVIKMDKRGRARTHKREAHFYDYLTVLFSVINRNSKCIWFSFCSFGSMSDWIMPCAWSFHVRVCYFLVSLCSCLLVLIDHKPVQDFHPVYYPLISWLDIHQRLAVFWQTPSGKIWWSGQHMETVPLCLSSKLCFSSSVFGRYVGDWQHTLCSSYLTLFFVI